MSIARNSLLIVVLMVTLVSQAMAYANVSCPSNMSSSLLNDASATINTTLTATIDHAQHGAMMGTSSVDSMEFVGHSGMACCSDCDCTMNGCASPLAALSASQLVLTFNSPSLAGVYSAQVSGQLIDSLLRPPIFG